MTNGTDDLLARVAACSVQLEEIIRDDLEFHRESLPHVFFGDISAWALSTAQGDEADPALRALVSFLEVAYSSGDESVQDVIGASFVENTYDDPVISKLYGPSLRAAAAQI